MDIEGKHALVTGAGDGIGRATSLLLARHGAASLTLVDIDEDKLLTTAGAVVQLGAKVTSYAADLRDTDCVQNLYHEIFSRHGNLDILFNNAGSMTARAPFPEQSVDQLIGVINLNLNAIIIGSKVAIDHMQKAKHPGVIINTASTAALSPMPADPAFAAAKVGILRFCQSCRFLHDSDGIRVVALCPGWTDTAMLPRDAEWLQPVLQNVQLLQPDDIAATVKRIIEDDHLAGDHVIIENQPRV